MSRPIDKAVAAATRGQFVSAGIDQRRGNTDPSAPPPARGPPNPRQASPVIDLDCVEILARLKRVEAAIAVIGHNNGPPLEDPPLPDLEIQDRRKPAVRLNPALALRKIIPLAQVCELTSLSPDSLKRNHANKIKRLGPRRLGMTVGDALAIGEPAA